MEEDFGGYIPLIIIALLAGMQIWMRLRAYSAKGKSTSLLKEYLQPEQLNAPRLIVYFWSEYCGPCKGMAPMVEKIMEKSPNLVKLNQHQHMGLARDLGAQGDAGGGYSILLLLSSTPLYWISLSRSSPWDHLFISDSCTHGQ